MATKHKPKPKRKPKAEFFDIRVRLKTKDVLMLKQVIFCDERGHSWAAEILGCRPVTSGG